MLQLSYIRENKDDVITRLAVKNFNAKESVEKILTIDADRRKIQGELDALNAEANIHVGRAAFRVLFSAKTGCQGYLQGSLYCIILTLSTVDRRRLTAKFLLSCANHYICIIVAGPENM